MGNVRIAIDVILVSSRSRLDASIAQFLLDARAGNVFQLYFNMSIRCFSICWYAGFSLKTDF